MSVSGKHPFRLWVDVPDEDRVVPLTGTGKRGNCQAATGGHLNGKWGKCDQYAMAGDTFCYQHRLKADLEGERSLSSATQWYDALYRECGGGVMLCSDCKKPIFPFGHEVHDIRTDEKGTTFTFKVRCVECSRKVHGPEWTPPPIGEIRGAYGTVGE